MKETKMPRGPQKTILTKDQISDLRNLSISELESKYAWSKGKISYFRWREKIKCKRKGKCRTVNLTEEQKQDLAILSSFQLRSKYGWSAGQVAYYRKREEIKLISGKRDLVIKVTEKQKHDLRTLPIKDLYKKYGWNRGRVGYLCMREGIKREGIGRHGIKIKLSDKEREDLAVLTCSEYAKKYAVSCMRVHYLRRRESIKSLNIGIKLNKEIIEDLKVLNSKEFHEKYDWSFRKISNTRMRLGIKDFPRLRKNKKEVPPAEELVGKTLAEVMFRFSVSRRVAYEWFRERGIPFVKLKGYRKRDAKIDGLTKRMRLMKIAAVMPYLRNVELARAFQLSRERIRQLRRDLGVPYSGGVLDEIKDGDLDDLAAVIPTKELEDV